MGPFGFLRYIAYRRPRKSDAIHHYPAKSVGVNALTLPRPPDVLALEVERQVDLALIYLPDDLTHSDTPPQAKEKPRQLRR